MQSRELRPRPRNRSAGFLVFGGRDVIDLDLAAELDTLAQAIARMRPPQNNNPHAFHEDRSELASRARALALRARGVGCKPSAAADVPAPIGRQRVATHQVRDLDGRSVLVLTRSAGLR